MKKIKYTDKELRSIIRVTADLYNGRVVSRERMNHALELIDRAPFMSFRRLCELVITAVECIEGQDARVYLFTRFDRNDKMGETVRGLLS